MKPYYDDGMVTIYHGDCREFAVGMDFSLVTDPPYGLAGVLHRPGPGEWEKLWLDGAPQWDKEAPLDLVAAWVTRAHYAIVWGGNYFVLPPSRGWLVWDKIVRQFSSGHGELAWTNLDQPLRAFSFSHGQLATEGKHHPTQKPLSLMHWCVGFLPADCGIVLDPFMGSGTTLVAAKDLGHRAIGIEIEERYCEIAAKRLRQEVLTLEGTA